MKAAIGIGAPVSSILARLRIVVPICFFLGAGMELFMIKTGFYGIVTRKEAERREERDREEARKRQRLEALKVNLNFNLPKNEK